MILDGYGLNERTDANAVAEAKKFGIGADRSVTFENDSQGVATNYEVVSDTLSCMRMASNMAAVDGSWKKRIEEDYNNRASKR